MARVVKCVDEVYRVFEKIRLTKHAKKMCIAGVVIKNNTGALPKTSINELVDGSRALRVSEYKKCH
jgi:hypothetical protein